MRISTGFDKRMLCHNIYGINDWVDITIGRFEHVLGTVMIHQAKIRESMIKGNSYYSSNDLRQTL
ncbi:hypothetical protein NARC_250009 [Candidatus Nitrosocosmicus arcticus]|uniref:Uncharacterized protein n=1 Tax=Candidatus Nitrosocosmicus arcticus TaxID=2035267 RepID=A0A557SQV5_9ARCH|nr:hypothetical protein NARC_250009 [Candidatus Nitrosocosmicus arcticus]